MFSYARGARKLFGFLNSSMDCAQHHGTPDASGRSALTEHTERVHRQEVVSPAWVASKATAASVGRFTRLAIVDCFPDPKNYIEQANARDRAANETVL